MGSRSRLWLVNTHSCLWKPVPWEDLAAKHRRTLWRHLSGFPPALEWRIVTSEQTQAVVHLARAQQAIVKRKCPLPSYLPWGGPLPSPRPCHLPGHMSLGGELGGLLGTGNSLFLHLDGGAMSVHFRIIYSAVHMFC